MKMSEIREMSSNPDLTTEFLVKWLRSTWMRRTAEKMLDAYERELLNYPAMMHEREKLLITYEKELLNYRTMVMHEKEKNLVSVQNDTSVECEKDFNDMTIDELIYLYWQVDESSSQEDNVCNMDEERDIEYTSLVCNEQI